jgi:hypothetical protein
MDNSMSAWDGEDSSDSSDEETLMSSRVHDSESSSSSEEEHEGFQETASEDEGEEEYEEEEEEGGRGDRPLLEEPSTRDSHALFRRFDTGAGALSFAEVQSAVRELWPQFDHEPPLRRAFEASDTDSNGSIGRREFHLLLSNIKHFDSLWQLFDTVESGNPENRMELEDFQAACAAVGLQTSEGAKEEFAECARAEGIAAGHLGFDYFCDWMLQQKRQAHLKGAVGKRPKPPPPARKQPPPFTQKQSPPAAPASRSEQRGRADSDTESDEDEVAAVGRDQSVEEPVAQAPATPAAEPELEPVYDSDSGDSELSDDDTAVALLARIKQASLLRGGTPSREGTPATSVTASPAQARLSQLLDELGSPPPGRGRSSRTARGSSTARGSPVDTRSAALRAYESPQATPNSGRSSTRRPSDSSAPASGSIHDRLYSHKTATTVGAVDPFALLAKVNLAKHGLSKEDMHKKAEAARIRAELRAKQKAEDEELSRQERVRAAAQRKEAKERSIRAMRQAALADKKKAEDFRAAKLAQELYEKESHRNAKREAVLEQRRIKAMEKAEEDRILQERRKERERQAAIDEALEEDRRQDKRRQLLLKREHQLDLRRQKQAAAMAETDRLFGTRIDAKAAQVRMVLACLIHPCIYALQRSHARLARVE